MDISALTAARIAVAKLSGADGCWHHIDTTSAALVQQFLETLPAVFAELEQARFNVNEKTITLRNVRDQLAHERALSDARLLKIEKLQAAAVQTVGMSGRDVLYFPHDVGMTTCRRCGMEYRYNGQTGMDEHNATCRHTTGTKLPDLPTTSIGTPP